MKSLYYRHNRRRFLMTMALLCITLLAQPHGSVAQTNQPFIPHIASSAAEQSPPPAPYISYSSIAIDIGFFTWDEVEGAETYNVYQSLTSGSGYTLLWSSPMNLAPFDGLMPGQNYYYVVTAVVNGIESPFSNEVVMKSGYRFTNLTSSIDYDAPGQASNSITYTLTPQSPTIPIYAWIELEEGDSHTPARPEPTLILELGYGPVGSDPAAGAWIWTPAQYVGPFGAQDTYAATLQPTQIGEFDFAYRARTNPDLPWLYVDTAHHPVPSQPTPPYELPSPYHPEHAGRLVVLPSQLWLPMLSN